MNFDRKDIEAVAKSRVARAEGNKFSYYVMVALLASIVAVFAREYLPQYVGLVIMVVGIIPLLLYWNSVSKKQTKAKIKLIREWLQEQEKK